MGELIVPNSIVRCRTDSRVMLVTVIFRDEDGIPAHAECMVYEGETLTTVWVPVDDLEAVTRY